MISFDVTKNEAKVINKIAHRAASLAASHDIEYPLLDAAMDITATHANGCPLDLERLLAANEFNFAHDVMGIRGNLDRTTGELTNCFLPRHARPSQEVSR